MGQSPLFEIKKKKNKRGLVGSVDQEEKQKGEGLERKRKWARV